MSSGVGGRLSAVSRPVTKTWVVLVDGDAEVTRWPLEAQSRSKLGLVDELARLQLAARRMGLSVRLCDPCRCVWDLVDWAGLATVVMLDGACLELGGEVARKAEGSEEVGVEEGVEPGDAIA